MMTASSQAHSVVAPSPLAQRIAGAIVVAYAVITMVPLAWIFLTGFKSGPDSIAYPPKVVFEPSAEGYCNLFTTRSRQTPEYIAQLPPATGVCDALARGTNMVMVGSSNYLPRFVNSLIIAFGSTALSVVLGVTAAYAFSRFKVPAKDDLLFFILSTRMMPPIAVAIPIYLMYRELGLSDTAVGMILLYTAVNVSLAVWLLKGFIDEIPREYEEAAMIDGYTRLQAFFKVVPAPTAGQSMPPSPMMVGMKGGAVWASPDVSNAAKAYSFQAKIRQKIAVAAMPVVACGRTTFQKAWSRV